MCVYYRDYGNIWCCAQLFVVFFLFDMPSSLVVKGEMVAEMAQISMSQSIAQSPVVIWDSHIVCGEECELEWIKFVGRNKFPNRDVMVPVQLVTFTQLMVVDQSPARVIILQLPSWLALLLVYITTRKFMLIKLM